MKPQYLKIATDPVHSFSVRQDRLPTVNNRWHYHAELELIQLHKGSGLQFVGDNIRRFKSGDIVLVGSNLPHYWYYDDPAPADREDPRPYSTVIHFREHFWGQTFLHLPENEALRKLLDKARRGILVPDNLRNQVSGFIRDIHQSDGTRRILALLQGLVVLVESEEIEILSSIGFQPGNLETEYDRINAVYDYTFKHFRDEIYLEQVADLVDMTPNSFCRYFKSRTGKTFTQFLLEFRVGAACRLLIRNQHNMKQVCYESGFHNLTSFHKTFKKVTGQTPLLYQQQYIH